MFEIGSSLREARLRRGLDFDDVAERTMVRARYLAALEDERFHLLPHGSYRRSFLREYAEFLGLDGDLYVDEYIARHEALEPEPPLVPAGRRAPIGISKLLKVTVALAVAAVVAVAVWGLGGTAPRRTALPAVAGAPPSGTLRPPPKQVAPHVVKAPVRRATLTLTAMRGRCWLSVHIGSKDGPLAYEQTLEQGQTVRFGLRTPLWIRLGAPQNLDAAIGRAPVSSLPTHVATVSVTARGVELR